MICRYWLFVLGYFKCWLLVFDAVPRLSVKSARHRQVHSTELAQNALDSVLLNLVIRQNQYVVEMQAVFAWLLSQKDRFKRKQDHKENAVSKANKNKREPNKNYSEFNLNVAMWYVQNEINL